MPRRHAYVWANGVLEFGPLTPEGALYVGTVYSKAQVRRLQSLCRLAHQPDPKTGQAVHLVPGIPEASTQEAGLAALHKWRRWAFPLKEVKIEGGLCTITDMIVPTDTRFAFDKDGKLRIVKGDEEIQ